MTMLPAFPSLSVKENEAVPAAGAPFLVAAMYTPSFADAAERLMASCRAFGLAYSVHQVPVVHWSISAAGSKDPACTKASFIQSILDRYGRPVLYVDADMVFRERPAKILALTGFDDFAIYNWAADPYNDCWFPVDYSPKAGDVFTKYRFWRFNHAMDVYAPSQLYCSGGVQYYATSDQARLLLRRWQDAIVAFPDVADDHCLDYAFNNWAADSVRAVWLDKSYLRLPWWIYVSPIIEHPQLPAPERGSHLQQLDEVGGKKRFYAERALQKTFLQLLPRDAVVDIEQGMLWRLQNGKYAPFARTNVQFYF